MQIQAYEGYFENGHFYTDGRPCPLPERRKTIVTVLAEPVKEETMEERLAWLDELHRLLDEAQVEPPLRMENFPRMDLGREPIVFADAG